MMETLTLYIPEDLIAAEPGTELSSDLDTHICLQHSDSPCPTLRGTTILSIWQRLDKRETKLDLENRAATVLHKKEEEKTFSAIPTPTGPSNMEIHLPEVDLGKAEREMEDDTERQQKEWETKEVRDDAQEHMCTLPPLEEVEAEQTEEDLQELQDLFQTWQNTIQNEELNDFDDIADLAEEMMEGLEEPKKDKSVRRRFLNWLNEHLEDHIRKKIARTYRREIEEGSQIYRTSYMARPMTRAQREQRKRQKLIYLDTQRQRVTKVVDSYWNIQRLEKEELRLKEEERYEKWAAAHGWSVPDSSPGQLKKRMSKWEKRFLKAKEFLSSSSN